MVGNLPLKLKIKRMCDLKMSWLPKPYKKWNIFEKKFFWLNNLGITIMMFGSVGTGIAPLSYELKIEIIVFLMMGYVIGRTWLWNHLKVLEFEWKRVAIDPITKEEVAS